MEEVATVGTIETTSRDEFDDLVAEYRPLVFRFALVSLRDAEAAESVTQDCFLKAWRARDRFRGECSVKNWFMRIAVNLIRDMVKSRRYRYRQKIDAFAVPPETERNRLVDSGMTPEARLSAEEQVAAIWKLADELSPNQRIVFMLRFMEEMDADEIEAVTGIGKAVIKMHLFRAVRAMREKLRGNR
jgi:RNA polymerase sigma-70 factor (ECF subfamily)